MEKRNYQLEMEAEIARLDGRRPSLLLHSCCGPCSSAVLERLTKHFHVTVLYYNPNIEPEEEYLHRLSEQKRLLSLLPEDIRLLPCDYDHEAFAAFAPALADAPEGGERCLACFALRLNHTAALAKQHGKPVYSIVGNMGVILQHPEFLHDVACFICNEMEGVRYLFADFKKKNGYLRSLQLSKEYGLYRQDYCGCLYSKER